MLFIPTAQAQSATEVASELVARIAAEIINPLIAVLFGLALLLFLWGAFQFVSNAASEEGRTVGKRHIVWGVVGMFIMVSVFAILRIIINTFGIPPP